MTIPGIPGELRWHLLSEGDSIQAVASDTSQHR